MWQEHIGQVARAELKRLQRPHLVAGQEAFAYTPKFRFPLDASFTGTLFDIVNVHPLPDVVLGGRSVGALQRILTATEQSVIQRCNSIQCAVRDPDRVSGPYARVQFSSPTFDRLLRQAA